MICGWKRRTMLLVDLVLSLQVYCPKGLVIWVRFIVLCYALLLHYHKSFFSSCSWNVWLYWINLFLRSGHEDIKLYGIYEIFAHYSGVQSQLVCSGCQKLLLYAHGATSICCAVCNAVTNVPPPGMFSSILLSSISPATIATTLTW